MRCLEFNADAHWGETTLYVNADCGGIQISILDYGHYHEYSICDRADLEALAKLVAESLGYADRVLGLAKEATQ